MKTAILGSILIAGALAFSGVNNFSAALPAGAAELDQAVVSAVKAKAESYEKAFNSGDAAAMSRMWMPDGNYINTDGTVYAGREQLEKLHSEFFAHSPKRGISIDVQSISENSPECLVERGVTTLVDNSGNPISRSPYIAVHRKVGGEWLLQSVVEMSPRVVPAKLTDLNFLVGIWKATSSDGQNAITLDTHIEPGGKFLISQFDISKGKERPMRETMITTVSPQSGKLVAWMFDANGGYGRGTWVSRDGKWCLVSHRIEPDGSEVDATHVIARDGSNGITWRAINRTTNGVALADLPAVSVIRTATK